MRTVRAVVVWALAVGVCGCQGEEYSIFEDLSETTLGGTLPGVELPPEVPAMGSVWSFRPPIRGTRRRAPAHHLRVGAELGEEVTASHVLELRVPLADLEAGRSYELLAPAELEGSLEPTAAALLEEDQIEGSLTICRTESPGETTCDEGSRGVTVTVRGRASGLGFAWEWVREGGRIALGTATVPDPSFALEP